MTKKRVSIIIPQSPVDWNNFIWNNKERVIYGPVDSRRLGKSLGVNLFPGTKACNYNCIYCDCGINPPNSITFTPVEELKRDIKIGLEKCVAEKTEIDYITFAGNGEPTLHPNFPEIVDYITQLKESLKLDKPTAIFTNAALLHKDGIADAVNKIDAVYIKMDGGDQATVNKIGGITQQSTFERVIDNTKLIKNYILSSAILFNMEADNIESFKRQEFVSILKDINPRMVTFYTIEYPTPQISGTVKREMTLGETVDEILKLGEYIAAAGFEVKAYIRREICNE